MMVLYMYRDSIEAGLGVVLCNEKGEVMAALAEKFPVPSLVELLEAMATWRLVLFILELNFCQSTY